MNFSRPLIRTVCAVLFLAAILATAVTPRTNTIQLFVLFGIGFALYLLINHVGKESWRWWLGVAVIARVKLLFMFPKLSDDIYRFFWDGTLMIKGINPFGILPMDLVAGGTCPASLVPLLQSLNSPGYYSVYPMTSQAMFSIAAMLGYNDIGLFAIVLKCLYMAAEIGTMYLLYDLLARKELILLYALNPLVLLELTGNAHPEAIMIFLLLLAYRSLKNGKPATSAVAMSLAIATKLIPLITLPFLVRRLSRKQLVAFLSLTAVITLILFVPVLFGSCSGFLSSVNLYFQRFEFNAGIYSLVRWFGFMFKGHNIIAYSGPVLALIGTAIIFTLAAREKKPSMDHFPRAVVLSIFVYLVFSTTVHPWYVTTLVAFCILTPYRFPVVWSGLIFLSYATYRGEIPEEIPALTALEYVGVLGYFIWETRRLTAPKDDLKQKAARALLP